MDNNNVNNGVGQQPNVANVPTQEPMVGQPNVISPEEIANAVSPPAPEQPVQQEPEIPVEAQNATPVVIPAEGVQGEVESNVVSPDQQVIVDPVVTGAPAQAVQQEEHKKSFVQKLFGKKEKN